MLYRLTAVAGELSNVPFFSLQGARLPVAIEYLTIDDQTGDVSGIIAGDVNSLTRNASEPTRIVIRPELPGYSNEAYGKITTLLRRVNSTLGWHRDTYPLLIEVDDFQSTRVPFDPTDENEFQQRLKALVPEIHLKKHAADLTELFELFRSSVRLYDKDSAVGPAFDISGSSFRFQPSVISVEANTSGPLSVLARTQVIGTKHQ